MSTPNKYVVECAEKLPVINDLLKKWIELEDKEEKLFEDIMAWKQKPDNLRELFKSRRIIANKSLETANLVSSLIQNVYPTCKQAFLFATDNINGKVSKENLTINSSLGNHAPPLTPKVGYEEAIRRLNILTPNGGDRTKITTRKLAGCLGLRGSEAHIIEFWNEAKPADQGDPDIKTNGCLHIQDTAGSIYFFHAKGFIERLYENYYLGLIRGDIKTISKGDKRLVKFVR